MASFSLFSKLMRGRKKSHSLFRQIVVKNAEISLMSNMGSNVDVEYFTERLKEYLNENRGSITPEIRDVVYLYLHGSVLDAVATWNMVIPEEENPKNYSPELQLSSDSNISPPPPGEAGVSSESSDKDIPVLSTDKPSSTSGEFDFETFRDNIIKTLLAVTNPNNRRNVHPNSLLWPRFRVRVLRMVAVMCHIPLKIYDHWFQLQLFDDQVTL